mmetsp:Transcript_42476/g.56048  ORF Transcript_42476/g.56048 Transcript_42476/m.56048 type:complete len:113 (+) Transcript_42476:139-477(+)
MKVGPVSGFYLMGAEANKKNTAKAKSNKSSRKNDSKSDSSATGNLSQSGALAVHLTINLVSRCLHLRAGNPTESEYEKKVLLEDVYGVELADSYSCGPQILHLSTFCYESLA